VRYGEAFKKLGYTLVVPRQQWSAEKDDGVCITLWEVELDPEFKKQRLDTRTNCGRHETWATAHGNHLRVRHLSKAMTELGGWVDVVLVRGTPGKGADDANPWMVKERKSAWRVVHFEPDTGHFIVELKKIERPDA
jgi:hypothetical protein